jgi:hypothetical protein
MNINFAFLRHGHGCHNALSPLYESGQIQRKDYKKLRSMTSDPELTQMGVDASIHNGCIISKILKNLHKDIPEYDMNPVNIIGSSPLIRCMETAFYMTRKWKNPPNKIYVFPYLREIDERSEDIYSFKSRITMDTTPGYAMKTIEEQKQYLASQGILQYFDFTFVENNLSARQEPGNISKFILWFSNNFLKNASKPKLNVFITTHAGVLKHFANEGFFNNSGIVVNTLLKKRSIGVINTVSLNKYLPDSFFSHYNAPQYSNKEYFCPSNRCGQFCTSMHNPDTLKRIQYTCETSDDDKLTSV